MTRPGSIEHLKRQRTKHINLIYPKWYQRYKRRIDITWVAWNWLYEMRRNWERNILKAL